jgi:ectoine hydroxylase-related dioxygenase (phytanoyl-CoA dioxygenase family)
LSPEDVFLGLFRQLSPASIDSAALQSELERHGYALIRGLIPTDEIRKVLGEISAILKTAGWIPSSAHPLDRLAVPSAACVDGDHSYDDIYDLVYALESLHAFPHLPSLQKAMKLLVGPDLLIHPKSSVRLIFPNYERGVIHAHQDYTGVGGDCDSFTAWIALHDCPLQEGPLRICEGSHRFGLQQKSGYMQAGTEKGDRWVEGDLQAGDVLIFHSLTVHEALPNLSDRLRISLDCRFQSYKKAVNPATLVFTSSGRSWEKIYASWQRDDLKYYWKQLPLSFKPTTSELLELADLPSETPKMRTRYANILRMIEAQYQ